MTRDNVIARPLAAGLVFGLAPVQVGLAVTVAVPALDRPESFALVYLVALAHVVTTALVVGQPGGACREPWALVRRAYLLPLGVAGVVAAGNSPAVCRAWDAVVMAARPDASAPTPAARPLGVDPPRAAPPADSGPLADRLAAWVGSVLRVVLRSAARVWVGTPVWAYVVAILAGFRWGRVR